MPSDPYTNAYSHPHHLLDPLPDPAEVEGPEALSRDQTDWGGLENIKTPH